MRMPGQINAFNNSDNVKALVTDKEIDEGFEALVRGAALKTVQDIKQGLSGVNNVNNEYEFDRQLNIDIEDNLLQGLAFGDLEPLTAIEFSRALRRELSSSELSGLFSKLKRAVVKVVKAPSRLVRKVSRVSRKLVKKHQKKLRKAALIAAAGAAVWYGGPYVMSSVKSAFGGAVANKAVAATGIMGPPPPPMVGPMPGEGYVDPRSMDVINTTAEMTKANLAAQGLQMNSPGAWDFLKGIGKGALTKIAQKIPSMMGPPPPPGYAPPGYASPGYTQPTKAGGMLPLIAIGGAAALLMLNK